MPISNKLVKFLEKNKVKYTVLEHRTVYTAFDKAQTLRVPEKMVGKTLVLKIDNSLALVLIPANKNLDKRKFLKVINQWFKKKLAGNSHGRIRIAEARRAKERYSHADFASEKLIKNRLKGVKVGAVPPFGNLWKIPTLIDSSLLKEKEIILPGGNYNFSIKITPAAFTKLIPDLKIGNFSQTRK